MVCLQRHIFLLLHLVLMAERNETYDLGNVENVIPLVLYFGLGHGLVQ